MKKKQGGSSQNTWGFSSKTKVFDGFLGFLVASIGVDDGHPSYIFERFKDLQTFNHG